MAVFNCPGRFLLVILFGGDLTLFRNARLAKQQLRTW
jgi:hypothetical protein